MWALSLSHRNIEAVCPLHYFVLIFSLTNTGNLGSVTVSRGSSFDGAIDFDYLDPSVTRIYAKFNGKIIPSPTLLHCRAFLLMLFNLRSNLSKVSALMQVLINTETTYVGNQQFI